MTSQQPTPGSIEQTNANHDAIERALTARRDAAIATAAAEPADNTAVAAVLAAPTAADVAEGQTVRLTGGAVFTVSIVRRDAGYTYLYEAFAEREPYALPDDATVYVLEHPGTECGACGATDTARTIRHGDIGCVDQDACFTRATAEQQQPAADHLIEVAAMIVGPDAAEDAAAEIRAERAADYCHPVHVDTAGAPDAIVDHAQDAGRAIARAGTHQQQQASLEAARTDLRELTEPTRGRALAALDAGYRAELGARCPGCGGELYRPTHLGRVHRFTRTSSCPTPEQLREIDDAPTTA